MERGFRTGAIKDEWDIKFGSDLATYRFEGELHDGETLSRHNTDHVVKPWLAFRSLS